VHRVQEIHVPPLVPCVIGKVCRILGQAGAYLGFILPVASGYWLFQCTDPYMVASANAGRADSTNPLVEMNFQILRRLRVIWCRMPFLRIPRTARTCLSWSCGRGILANSGSPNRQGVAPRWSRSSISRRKPAVPLLTTPPNPLLIMITSAVMTTVSLKTRCLSHVRGHCSSSVFDRYKPSAASSSSSMSVLRKNGIIPAPLRTK